MRRFDILGHFQHRLFFYSSRAQSKDAIMSGRAGADCSVRAKHTETFDIIIVFALTMHVHAFVL